MVSSDVHRQEIDAVNERIDLLEADDGLAAEYEEL